MHVSFYFFGDCAVSGEALGFMAQMGFRSLMSLSSGFKLLAGLILRSDSISIGSIEAFQIQTWSGTSELIYCNVKMFATIVL